MRKRSVLQLLAFLVVGTTMMYSQATRTWVSGVGDDANPCSRTAPCKTWAGAISKTATGGEIDALDPGGFGALTITKSITLDGGGGQVASTLVAGTNGIVVAGSGGNEVVIIRNIRINGIRGTGNGGTNGIQFISGAFLSIENCTIFGFTGNGINVALGATAQVNVVNTVSTNNGGAGLRATTSAGSVGVSIDNSNFAGNQFGVFADANAKITVSRSAASGNTVIGFIAQSNTAATQATVDLVSSVAANNTIGVQAGGGTGTSLVEMATTAIMGNSTGIVTGLNGTTKTWTSNFNRDTGTPSSPGGLTVQ